MRCDVVLVLVWLNDFRPWMFVALRLFTILLSSLVFVVFVSICTKNTKARDMKNTAGNMLIVPHPKVDRTFGDIAKDCLLTLVKSRLALGSPGWLVGCDWLSPSRK